MKKFCCITCLVVFILIIVLICVTLFVLTPNMIGLGDTVISDGKTLNDLGLGDVTVYEALCAISTLTSQKDAQQVLGDDAYTENDLDSAVNGLGIEKGSDGEIDYSNILSGTTINQTGVTVTLTDKEFAAVADDIVDYLGENLSGEGSNDQMADILKNVNIYQLSPKVSNVDGSVEITTTVGINVKELMGDNANSSNDNPLSQVINSLPDELIVTMTLPISHDATDGYVINETDDIKNIKVNGQEIDIVNDIINNLELGTGEDAQTVSDMLHGAMGEQITGFLNSWGVTLGNGSVTIAPAN